MGKDQICGTCQHHKYEHVSQGWECVNGASDYCTHWTEYNDTCEHWEERE